MEDPFSYTLTSILQISGVSSTTGMVFGIAGLLILLICSAFISGSEVAFFSLSNAEKDEISSRNSKVSNLLIQLLDHPRKLLATILIANNAVNIAIVILSTILISPYISGLGDAMKFIVQVVAVTFLILLFGEVTPKVYASRHAHSFSHLMTVPIYVLSKLFSPLSALLISTTKIVERGFKPQTSNISVDELSHALELTSGEVSSESEQQILKGIVKFGNTDVKQIMQPRLNVTAFNYETPFPELLTKIVEAGFSRVPVFRENFDNIVGVLYIKDLLKHINEKYDFNWQQLVRTPFFVPENKKIDDLLNEFQERKIHLAVVVDEYGGASGIVTMEDIIEEIVGDINDEFDDDDLIYSRLDKNTFVFEGRTPLNDLFRVLAISGEEFEKSRGDSDTLAGFLLELEGRIPPKNTVINFGDYSFKIESVDKRRIKTVKVEVKTPEEEGKSESQ